MELIERPNLKAVEFLNSKTYSEYKNECIQDALMDGKQKPKEKDMKAWFATLKQFCATNIKTKGITKRIYSYSLNTPAGLGGRLFSGGSIQGIWGKYRGLLMRGLGTDIDMANAHPTILRYVCHLHQITCPCLEYYVNNRDICLSQFSSRAAGKESYLIAMNNDKYSRNSSLPKAFRDFDKEMKTIQKTLGVLDDYKDLIDTVPESKKKINFYGCVLNRILCYFENIILQHVIHVINNRGIEVAVLMFDGLIIYGDFYDRPDLLMEIQNFVDDQMPGLNMKWAYKPHDTNIEIPEDFTIPDKQSMPNSFESVAAEFEKNHCKIINKTVFIKEVKETQEIVIMSRDKIKTSYENLTYSKMNKDEETIQVNFIEDWLRNNPNQRCYEDVGIFPKPSLCPKTVFNLWRPFDMENIKEYTENQEGLKRVLNHIKILCNHEETAYNYLINYIGQMIQYPEVKSICITLISEQGAGKGRLLYLLTKMLGKMKVFETSTPSRDVWGDFNGQMAQAFLVNLDELSKKETTDSEGKMKALITEPTLTINNKGVNQYPIDSYHRFLITTNKSEPINTSHDDRRNVIIRSSDELCGNKEYYNELHKYLDDVNVIKTCYEYFKALPGLDKFGTIPLPTTEYHNNLKQLSSSPIENWLKDFTEERMNKDFVELTPKELFECFCKWKFDNNVSYEVDKQKFGVRLALLKVSKGAITSKHTNSGDTKRLDIKKLKSLFGIGCLIDTDSLQ